MSEKLILSKAESPRMFDAIAGRYDLLNRLLSLGQDIRWRDRLKAQVPLKNQLRVLDVATGTADVLIALAQGPHTIQGTGLDPSAEMLAVGRAKIRKAGLDQSLTLIQGDAQNLPFEQDSFDCVTISFGIRNIPDLRLALLEMYRVLKPGGSVLILEFSKPSNPILYAGHWFYMNTIVPAIGFLFSGNWKAYQYLNQTVHQFPYGEQMCRIIKQFGFNHVRACPLMGGVATLYAAVK